MKVPVKLLYGLGLVNGIISEGIGLSLLIHGQSAAWGSILVIGGGLAIGAGIANIACGANKYLNVNCKYENKEDIDLTLEPTHQIDLSSPVANSPAFVIKGVRLSSITKVKSPSATNSNSQYEPIQ